MTAQQHLYELTDDFKNLQEMVDQGELSQEDIVDTLEAIDCAIEQKTDGICAVIANIGESIPAIEKQIERLKKRQKSVENEQKKLRGYLLEQLQKIGKKNVKTDAWTVSIRKGSDRVVVDNVGQLPDECVEVVTDIKPLNTEISKLFRDGKTVDGAHIETGNPSIQIR